ncbi:hypothetical protein ACRHM7_01020 [Chromohalobacter israelensis]|uniref:hypothetical protein n=1 Tax=Chromohalobacter israelensis TaxID=141390 RepID=UPI003D7B2D52
MQRKYKTPLAGLFLLGAGLLAVIVWQESDPIAQALLAPSSVLLALLAWHSLTPRVWRLVVPCCALQLAGLLWRAPLDYAIGLWVWPMLLLPPQPRALRACLLVMAAFGWWQVQSTLAVPQSFLSGMLLSGLMLLGLARAAEHTHLRQELENRHRLAPGKALWSLSRLRQDIEVEWSRRQRENVHVELLVMRPRQRGYGARERLGECLPALTRAFEGCYRVNPHTFGVLLVSPDAQHAVQRRDALIAALPMECRVRVAAVTPDLDPLTLGHALAMQTDSLSLAREEEPDHA